MSSGKATIIVESGKNLKNVEFFGKQDPYVVLEVGDQKYKTEVAKNGGANPVFNQTFEVPASGHEEINLIVMDDETLADELIGRGKVSLKKAKTVGTDRQDVQLFTKDGRDAGHLIVTVRFPDVAHSVPHGVPAAAGGHCAPHSDDHHHGHHKRNKSSSSDSD